MSIEQLAELRGVAKGVICDGIVNPLEANALREWLIANSELLDTSPCDRLAAAIIRMLEDSRLDDGEAEELRLMLRELLTAFEVRDRTRRGHRGMLS